MSITASAPRTVVPRKVVPRRVDLVRAPAAPARPARGLPLAAAVLLAVVVAVVGIGVDMLGGRSPAGGLGVGVMLGCLLAAVAVRRRDTLRMAFAPPLVYAGLALADGLAAGTVGRDPRRQALELFTVLVLHAEVVVGSTLLTLLVVLLRVSPRRRRA